MAIVGAPFGTIFDQKWLPNGAKQGQGIPQEPPPRAPQGPPGGPQEPLQGASGTPRGTVEAPMGPFGVPRGAPDPQNEATMVPQASPGHPKWHHFGDENIQQSVSHDL